MWVTPSNITNPIKIFAELSHPDHLQSAAQSAAAEAAEAARCAGSAAEANLGGDLSRRGKGKGLPYLWMGSGMDPKLQGYY